MSEEEKAFHYLLNEYMQIPEKWEDYQIIKNAIKQNKQLKNNWNELKKWLEELQQEEFNINGFTGVCTEIRINCILNKMQELEGSND